MSELCKGCRRVEVYASIGLCGPCVRRVRNAARELVALLWCLANDEVLELLGRLAWRASSLYDGTAAAVVDVDDLVADGWGLSSEVH
jgi:hypothetical protein